MCVMKRKVAVVRKPLVSGSLPKTDTKSPTIVVARPQTPDEQHRFRAAADALLAELVRQQMGRGKHEHGQEGN
jgi:hypothetical protein